MQVERPISVGSGARVSKTQLTYLQVPHNGPKGPLIGDVLVPCGEQVKVHRLEMGLRPIS